MTLSERTTRNVQLESWEIGGELLDILSRGLYSDAKDALREYVQNGVDAKAQNIWITIDGGQAVIRDDGHGMNDEGIRAARRFGMSNKSPNEMVGYRGIGIYSAFGICEEMTITSRQAGMPYSVGWRFEFGQMRRLLEADKTAEVRQGIGLPELLFQYTQLFTEPYLGDVTDQFTVVEIDGLDQEYVAQLNDAAEVNDYLLSTIPVAFAPHGYGEAINKWLSESVHLNPVRISLTIADNNGFDVTPPIASEVFAEEFDRIDGPDGTPLALVWYALATNGRQLPSYDGSALGGFLLKIKGFTLGDRLALKPLWPAVGGRTLYHHYTGEVHVLDAARLYPNAARDDLESTEYRQRFLKSASDFFDPLSRKARLMQAKARAERLLEGIDAAINQLTIRKDAPNENAFELYKDGMDYRSDLERVFQQIKSNSRKPRMKPRVQLNAVQQESVDSVLIQLQLSINRLGGVVRDAQRRTQGQSASSRSRVVQPLPQEILLNKALIATVAMADASADLRLKQAAEALKPLVRMRAIPRAIGILDDLKAEGVELGNEVEASRKELRSSIGWSPLAPVSLEEAITQQGVSLETQREEIMIRAIDRGLAAATGGRGASYESISRAIAESVVEELGS